MLLTLAQARPDLPPERLMTELVRIRSKAWPNLLMVKHGDALLGRGGALVAAVKAHYQERLRLSPEFGPYFRSVGREEEVDG